MLLLGLVIQNGASVSNRFEMETTLSNAIRRTGFEDLMTLSDYYEW